MTLKAKIANKVLTNKEGLVEGTVTQVLEIDERTEIQKGKEIIYGAQFEFQIESEGSQKPIVYRVWTRQSFDNEMYVKADESKDYNGFTRLMLQLELINEADLKDLQNPKLANFDVEAAVGLKVQFELEPSKNVKGLKVPKVSTIKPLKSA
ncbi:MAG: hypothetical protein ICV54_06970 [Nostoc sp. C3-bin3]|nr:hypothetical protein [Nostoc sp. C3-bin3]